MNTFRAPDELIQHVCQTGAMSPQQASHLILEVMYYFHQSSEHYVRTRHQDLQKAGFSNAQIYAVIEQELQERLFPAPAMSIRQIRRLIYG